MAKITKATQGGRTIYKIVGTSKYALTLAKAKEIAAKMGGAKRTTAGKRVGRGRGSVEEGYFDTKGRRGVRVSRKKPTAAAAKKYAAFESELALDVVRSVKGGLTGYLKAHNAFKKDAYKAAAKYDVNADYISPSFTRAVLRELEAEIRDLQNFRVSRTIARVEKETKTPAGRAKYRRLEKAATSTRGLKSARGVSRPGAKQVVALAVPRPTRARLMDFYRDIKEMGAEALAERGISPATEAFALKVRSALEDAMDEAEGITRKKSAAYISASGRPAIKRTTRKPAVKKAKKTASRRKPKTRTPKLIGRAYTNRYGERVGPTRILGRTVDYAMKIVRTKGRDLKATPAHRKEIVAKYRKGLQKAGFLRGAATRSNSRGADSGPLPKGYFEVVPAASKAQKRRHEELGHRILLKVTLTGMGVESNVRPPLPNTVAHLRETYHFTRKDAEAVVRAAADAPTGEWIEARGPSRPRGGPLVREMRPQV